MSKRSAGILLYRFRNSYPEILLVHPGGPFWSKKDQGVWSIPKGEFNDDEDPLTAAIREFNEETGMQITGEFIPLMPVKQKSGKIIYAFAMEGDFEILNLKSNTFTIEWPPKSGKEQEFPEIDRAGWFDLETAGKKIIGNQSRIIDEIELILKEKYF